MAAAALALLLDGIIRGLERGLRERRRLRSAAALLALGALVLWTVSASWLEGRAVAGTPLRIGSKTFTEQYVLSEIVARRIQRAAGRSSATVQSLGSTVLFEALRQGDLDLYVDYSGTIWATLMQRKALGRDRERVLAEVEQWLHREHGIDVVASLGFENTYALAMRAEVARARGVESIGHLKPLAPQLILGGDYEFFGRPEWSALREAYDLDFAELRSMDPALMYRAVATGDVDVISAFSTDGRIEAFELRVLEDPRGVIPPYDAILLARPGLGEDAPEVVAALRGLEGALDARTMRKMNLAVDRGGRSPGRVAQDFLERAALPEPEAD